MAGTRLDAIRNELEQELEVAEAEAGRLKAELSAAEKDVKAIKDALIALGRKPGAAPKKPAIRKVEVIRFMKKLLTRLGRPISRADLDATLSAEVSKQGKSATGLQLRIKEALAGDEFTVTDKGISLAENVSVQQ